MLKQLVRRTFNAAGIDIHRLPSSNGSHAGNESSVESQLNHLRAAVGRIEARQLGYENASGGPLACREFQVFSQWGEDGIIQYLVREAHVEQKTFVEFGVQDYREANTRFLAERDNWSGLVMDSSAENIESIRRMEVCWRQGLKAVEAFVTRDNINALIGAHYEGEIGLLSIDIDGNDYWVWKTIDVVSPVIVVIEYNHRFGRDLAVTIPYDEGFRWGTQYPLAYYGASLRALCLLGASKGYAFLGCCSNGANAFFVRRDRLTPALRELTPEEGYVRGVCEGSLDERERLELLRLPLVTVNDEGEAE